MMKMKCLCTALLIGLLASGTAVADPIAVTGTGGTFAVDSFFDVFFEVDIPAPDELVGWALDVSWDESLVTLDGYTIGGDWDEGAPQPDDPDVLDLGALAFPPPFVTGTSLLFTLHFHAGMVEGAMDVVVSWQEAELEGFSYETGYAVVDPNTPAHVEIIPEPATLALLAFGALALIRRR